MEPYLAVPLLDAEESREGRVNSPKILGPLQQRENVRTRAAGSGDRPVTRWRVHRVPGPGRTEAGRISLKAWHSHEKSTGETVGCFGGGISDFDGQILIQPWEPPSWRPSLLGCPPISLFVPSAAPRGAASVSDESPPRPRISGRSVTNFFLALLVVSVRSCGNTTRVQWIS